MADYILKRVLWLVPTLFVVSIVAFLVIQLPPGDFLTIYIATLEEYQEVDPAVVFALRQQYGLDRPVYVQYLKWIAGVVRGRFGMSLTYHEPVKEVIWQRLCFTVLISLASLLFIWMVALPVGIYSAVRQYSLPDYLFTLISFIGLGIPSFMLALIVMWIAYSKFGASVGGLFSAGYANAPWSWSKAKDLLKHIWVPMVVLGTGGTASLIRIMRANLLDELHKPYVVTARAKGLRESRLVTKYPVRVALNPFVSTIGWTLPQLVSGSTVVSVVLSLPTTGPVLLRALLSQDMFLAGAIVLLLSVLTVIGTLVSDVLLALLDPRVRFQ